MSKYRVLRGGSYVNDSGDLRATRRFWNGPGGRGWPDGFRIVVKRKKQ
jgi:formylglycine-generating enzyme required for sulfatase activity